MDVIREIIEERARGRREYETGDGRRYTLRAEGFKTFILYWHDGRRLGAQSRHAIMRCAKVKFTRHSIDPMWQRAEVWAKKQIRAHKTTIALEALKEL